MQPGSQSKLYNEGAAAQQALKREATTRQMHNKELHAKQSIRRRQQEYDQAVKARLAQDAAVSNKSDMNAQHAQQPPKLAAASGAALGLSGPRVKKLQAFVRHPRPPQLPTPPRHLSRMPDNILLPDIGGKESIQPRQQSRMPDNIVLPGIDGKQSIQRYTSNGMADVLMDDESGQAISGMTAGSPNSLLPRLVSQASSARRLTQELPP